MDRIDKLLARIPHKHRLQLADALDSLADATLRASLRSEKLAGTESTYRLRVGRYRIIFHIEKERAIVDDIRPRNERTYRDF